MTYLEDDLNILAHFIHDQGFENKSILITGATGLIGSLIVRALMRCNQLYNDNIKIIAIVRSIEKARIKFSGDATPGIQYIEQNIEDTLRIELSVNYIIHTASPTASRYFITNPVETIETIYRGSKNILEFGLINHVQGIVYISSMEVFGSVTTSNERIGEHDLGYLNINNIRSCYSEGKRLVECMCKCYATEYDLPVKIARLSQVFGPGISADDNRIFAQLANSVLREKDIILHTTGESIGNYCYTRDAIKAIFVLLIDGVNGDPYTIVNESSTMSIYEMAQMVARDIAKNKVRVLVDSTADSSRGYAPSTKMRLSSKKMNELNWNAEVGLTETYERMIGDFQCSV